MTQDEFLMLCFEGRTHEIEEALKNGADPNEPGMLHGISAHPLFVAAIERNFEAVRILVENGANPAEGFIASIITNKIDIAIELVDLGADINSLDHQGHTALLCAVTANRPNMVKWLTRLGADVNIKTAGGYNVLTYSALMTSEHKKPNGDSFELSPEIISILMENGADYDDALTLAIKTDNTDFVTELIKNGADLNRKCMMDQSPLSVALLNVKNEVSTSMIELLASNGADVNEVFDFGDGTLTNPLNICISMERPDIAEILLNHGANPNVRDSNGRTSLVFAVLTDNEILKLLLEHGADPDIPDNEGRTPLMLAALDGESESETAEILITHGADINIQDKDGLTALIWAVSSRDRSTDFLLSGLIRTGGLKAEGIESWFALASLYSAVKREMQIDVIRTLITHGADVNIRDDKNMNALSYAILNDDKVIADMLISAGSDIEFKMI